MVFWICSICLSTDVLSNTGIPCALAGVAAARLPIDTAAKKSCFIVSLLSAWAPAPVKFRQPELRIIAQFGNHFAGHARCLSAPRQHGEFIVHANEIQADHNGVMALLHEEFAAFRRQLFAHQLKFRRSEEHTSELQSLMRISYAVFCLKKKKSK